MAIHRNLKSKYLRIKQVLADNRVRDYWWFAEQEINTWKNWVELPLHHRSWLWHRGFTSPCGKLYDFERYGPEAYLSELQRNRLFRALNGRHRYLLDDKLSQHWMTADYPENRPAAYGFIDRGLVHGVSGTEFEEDAVPVSEWLPTKLRRESALVLKKLRGKGGKEVLVCEYEDGYILDGERISEEALCDEVEALSGYLVSEFIRQHAYADELYPHSTNTIRLLTLWDDESRELHTPIAVHRIGTERSRPVDNCSSGGITAEIDLETGVLGRGAQLPFSGDVRWFTTHPDTGSRIAGTSVPEWKEIRTIVEQLARDNTHIPMIGWDILLDESGEPIVIEANSGSSLDLLQVHQPLLENPHVARVASRHLPEVSQRSNQVEHSSETTRASRERTPHESPMIDRSAE